MTIFLTLLFHPGYSDISGSFYIDGSGRVYEGRGWDINSAYRSSIATGEDPGYAYGDHVAVTLFGDFTTQAPTAHALRTLRNFVECAAQDGKMTSPYTVLGHEEDYSLSYECPGDALMTLLHNWPNIIPWNEMTPAA